MLLVAVIVSGLTLARNFAPDEDEETADDEKRRHGHPSIKLRNATWWCFYRIIGRIRPIFSDATSVRGH